MLCYTYLWCSRLSIIDFFSFSFSFSIAIRPAHIDYLSILLFGDSDIFAHFSCSLSHSRSLRFFFFLISVVTVAVMLLLHIFSDFFSQHRLWLSIHAYKRIIACICFSFSHRQMCAAKRKSIALTRSPYPLNTEHRTEQPMHDFTVKY